MLSENQTLKSGTFLLPRRWQLFLIIVGILITESENSNKKFLMSLKLFPELHTEAFLRGFIGFENLKSEGPVTIILMSATVSFTLLALLRFLKRNKNIIQSVFSTPRELRHSLADEQQERSTWHMYRLFFVAILLDVLWMNYVPFQDEICTNFDDTHTIEFTNGSLLEKIFFYAHVTVFRPKNRNAGDKPFFYQYVPLLAFDILRPRFVQLSIYCSVHILLPFLMASLGAFYGNISTVERTALNSVRRFAVLRFVITTFSGIFLYESQKRMLVECEPTSMYRFRYLMVSAIACLLSVWILRTQSAKSQLKPREISRNFFTKLLDKQSVDSLGYAALIILFTYFLGFILLWELYCLQLLLPRIISVAFYFTLFTCLSSAILVANLDFLALIATAVSLSWYYSRQSSIFECVGQYIQLAFVFLMFTYSAAGIQKFYSPLRKMVRFCFLVIFFGNLSLGTLSYSKGHIPSQFQYFAAVITHRLPEIILWCSSWLKYDILIRLSWSLGYKIIFSQNEIEYHHVMYFIVFLFILHQFWRSTYVHKLSMDIKIFLLSSLKHMCLFQGVLLFQSLIQELPFFSSLPSYVIFLLSIAALCVMIGIQHDFEYTISDILNRILP